MMADDRTVCELDLLAYADGLLDADPAHKAVVEKALRSDPAARARADASRAQTDALRAAYGGRLVEPVPDRLRAALQRPSRPAIGRYVNAAALVALTVAAGGVGWMLGESAGPTGAGEPGLQRFGAGIHARFVSGAGTEDPQSTPVVPTALDWLSDEISIRLKAPDLSLIGYRLSANEAVSIGNERLVQLDYAGPQGRSFSLFLAPRWKAGTGEIAQDERNGIAMAYWEDGPLASTIVARTSAGEMQHLAEAVRSALRADGETPALVEPVPAEAIPVQTEAMVDTLADPTVGATRPGMPIDGVIAPN